jgi:hypothetical protein
MSTEANDHEERVAMLERRAADVQSALSKLTGAYRPMFVGLRMRPNNVECPENPRAPGINQQGQPDNAPLPEAPYLWREHGRFMAATNSTGSYYGSPDGRNCRVVDEDTPGGVNYGKLFQPAGGQFLVMEMTDMNPDGSLASRFIEVPRGLFPVKVAKTGGVQGTQTTPATWTYTVRELSGGGEFYPQSESSADGAIAGEDVEVVLTRPDGQFMPGEDYGVAFFHGQTLKLWDAGELLAMTEVECP